MVFFDKESLRLFFIFWIIFSLFATYDRWNDNASLDLTRSIVDEHRLEIDSYANNTGDKVFYNGHYYSDKVPGSAFLAVPLYIVFDLFFGKIPIYPSLYINNPSWKYTLFLFLCISLISSVCGALTVVLVYKTLRFFTRKKLLVHLVTIVYGLGTLQIHAARQFNSHAISTFFIFLSFYLILTSIKKNRNYFFLGGLAGGFAILTEYRAVLLIPICFFFSFYSKNWKRIINFVIGVFIFILILFVYHQVIYDNPFDTHRQHNQYENLSVWINVNIVTAKMKFGIRHGDYNFLNRSSCDNYKQTEFHFYCLEGNINKSLQRKIPMSFNGKFNQFLEDLTGSYFLNVSKFTLYWQYWTVGLRLLFDPYRGLFFYFPILLLSFFGMFFLYKQEKLLTITILASFLLVLISWSKLVMWWIGLSFGVRHMTFLMPFLMIPLLFALKNLNIKVFLFLGGLSILISIVGLQSVYLSHESHMSPENLGDDYIERFYSWKPMGNPLVNNYIPSLFRLNHRDLLLENLLNVSLIPFLNLLLALFSFFWIYRLFKSF